MLISGDYLLPHVSGIIYPDKPPAVYWIMALSMKLFGVTAAAIRLPSVLAMGAILLLLKRYCERRHRSQNETTVCLLICASNLMFLALGQLATLDMVLSLLVCSALLCGRDWIEGGKTSNAWWCGLSLGLTILIKGPIGLLLVMLILGTYAAFPTTPTRGRRLLHPALWLPILSIGMAWFFLAAAQVPELWDFWLGRELVDRLVSNSHAREQGWWFFPLLTLISALPWLIGLLAKGKPTPPKNSDSIARKDIIFHAAWILIPIVVFSIPSGKQPAYLAPALPGLALLLAPYWARTVMHRRFNLLLTGWIALIAVTLAWHLEPINTRSEDRASQQLLASEGADWQGAQLDAWSYGLGFQLQRYDLAAHNTLPSTWTFSREYLGTNPELFKRDLHQEDSLNLLGGAQAAFLLVHDRNPQRREETVKSLEQLCTNRIYRGVEGRHSILLANRPLRQLQ